jgi:hypothetical protein
VDPSTPSTTRRAFLRTSGIAGAALAAGVALSDVAYAADSAADETTTGAPTTKIGNFNYPELPKKPVGDDLLALAFAASLEQAAVQIYDAVLASKPTAEVTEVLTEFRSNHAYHASSLSGLAGPTGVTVANRALLADYGAPTMNALSKLEETLVATLSDLLGQLTATDASALVAGIITITARQAVSIGLINKLSEADFAPSFDLPDKALKPAKYPAERV